MGMLGVKGDIPVYSSIVFAGLVEYTFVFMAYMVTRTGHRSWQFLKYIISGASAAIFAAVPWAGIFLAFGVGLGINALICVIGYAISPTLRYDDKIHRLMAWCGGKDLSKVKEQVDGLLLKRLAVLLTRWEKLLATADKLVAKGHAGGAEKAQRTYLKLITELEKVSALPEAGKRLLGQAYLGLGKAQQVLGQGDKATASFIKAKSCGVWDKAWDSVVAPFFASSGSHSPEAIEAYLAYLSQRRGEAADDEKKTVIAVLESLCHFAEEELGSLVRNLSRTLAFQALGEEITGKGTTVPSSKVSDIKTLNQKVVGADPDISWAHYYLGLAYLFSDKTRQALAEFEETGKLSPGQYPITYYLGLAHASLGRTEPALSQFEAVADQEPQYADSQFHGGRLLLLGLPSGKTIFTEVLLVGEDEPRLRKAISYLHKAVDLCSDRADYYFYAGLAHLKAGEYGEVQRYLSPAVALEPQWKEFHYLLAMARKQLKEYQGARESLEQAIKLSASYQVALSLLGQVCFEQGDWAGAESNCRQAVQMDSLDRMARSLLSRALFLLGRYSEAVAELSQLLQPEEPEVLYCLGRSLMKTDRFEAAIPVLKQLAEMEHAARTSYLLGCAYANLGNLSNDGALLDAALTWFDKATEAAEPPAEVYLQRANVRLRKGQFPEAYTDLQHSLTLKPEEADVAYALGVYYHAVGDNEKAVSEFQRVIKISPNHGQAYFVQGLLREAEGDLSTAGQLYTLALERTRAPEAQLRLGIVRSKLGDNKKAVVELTKARKLGMEEDALHYYLGQAYAMVSSYESAIDEWQKLLKKHAGDKQLAQDIIALHQLRAQQLLSEGDYEGSIHHWETCLKLYGQEGESPLALCQGLAEACFRLGVSHLRHDGELDYQKARESLQKAASLDDRNSTYQYYLALASLSTGDVKPASSILENLLIREPANKRCQYPLALALVQAGEHERAIPLLTSIIQDNERRNHFGARLLLADCYRILGKWEHAAETLKLVLEVED